MNSEQSVLSSRPFCSLTLLVSLQVVSHEQMVCAKRFLWVDGFKFLFFALHPLPLSNATEELKGDREIVLAAVSEDGAALESCHRGAER